MTEGKRRPGRPPGTYKDPVAIARALELIALGECANPLEAAEHPEIKGRIGWRQIYEAKSKAAKAAAVQAAKEAPAAPVVVATLDASAPPPGLGTRERRLWRVEQRIESLSRMLAKAEAEGNMARIGPLSGELRKWLAEQAELQPKEEDDPQAEEKRWRADADHAVAKIREGVSDARERMAARLGTPFRGAYLELVRSTAGAA